MHPQYQPRETLRERLVRDLRAMNTLLDDPRVGGQVLERLPSGEYAWLRPATQPTNDEPRYVLTDQGRRDLRIAEALGCDPDDVA